MKKRFLVMFLMAMVVVMAGCTTSDDNDPLLLKISAAVSLKDVLEEMKESYEREHDVVLSFNLAGSGTLARQIQQGAPVDVFISADEQWINILENDNLVVPETREIITGNNLALITNNNSSLSYESFSEIVPGDIRHVGVGNPDSVPAGQYTKDALTTLDMWDSIQDKIVLAKDVRQVLTYVETGNVDLGFVYESDALRSENIKILAIAETGLHESIHYPGAIISGTKNEEEANVFLDYLSTDEAQDILAKHGFQKR